MTQILISGAGIAGCALAALLVDAGHDVTLEAPLDTADRVLAFFAREDAEAPRTAGAS